MEINVREVQLPGVGVRFELDHHDGGTLFVVAERSGRRHLGATRSGEDRPAWSVELDQRQAVTIAALLLGARFTVDAGQGDGGGGGGGGDDAETVVVDTVQLGPDSPLLGRTLTEISLEDPDAMVLALIDDETPALVEHQPTRRCRPDDRVVLAARASRIATLAAELQGPRPPGHATA